MEEQNAARNPPGCRSGGGVSPKRRGWRGRGRQSRARGEHLGANELRRFLHQKFQRLPSALLVLSAGVVVTGISRFVPVVPTQEPGKKGGSCSSWGVSSVGVREKQRNICSGLIFFGVSPPSHPPQKKPQLCRCFAFLWYRGCAAALRLRAVSSGFFPWKGWREAGMGRWGRWHRWLGRRLAHGEAGEGLCPRQKPMARVCPRRFSREDLAGGKDDL